MAERRDWLLLLLALRDASQPLDPVRLQKGMFLLAQERELPQAQRYRFRPYDYGPFSSRIYSDLDDLVAAGFVERIPAPGYTWSRYRATEAGIAEAQRVLDRLPLARRADAVWLGELKRHVLALEFRALLHHVYGRHPEFAENSVFQG
jgi:uncharacterized protein YwgA